MTRLDRTLRNAAIPAAALRRLCHVGVGRQLFVDDFLIEECELDRSYHSASYFAGNPILKPVTAWDIQDQAAGRTIHSGRPRCRSATASGSTGGPAVQDVVHGRLRGATCYADSTDGLAWRHRPPLDIRPRHEYRSERGARFEYPCGLVATKPNPGRVSRCWCSCRAADVCAVTARRTASIGRLQVLVGRPGIARPSSTIRSARCGSTVCETMKRRIDMSAATVDTLSRVTLSPCGLGRTRTPSAGSPRTTWIDRAWTTSSLPAIQLGLCRLRKRAPRPVHDLLWRPGRTAQAESGLRRIQPRRLPLGEALARAVHRRVGAPGRLELDQRPVCRRVLSCHGRSSLFLRQRPSRRTWDGKRGRVLDGPRDAAPRRLRVARRAADRLGKSPGLRHWLRAVTTRPVRFTGSCLFVNVQIDGGELRADVARPVGTASSTVCAPLVYRQEPRQHARRVRWPGASLADLAGKPVRFRFIC